MKQRLLQNKKISAKDAGLMLNYCVNAGPAFIIGAVGTGFFRSTALGYILAVSHYGGALLNGVINGGYRFVRPGLGTG